MVHEIMSLGVSPVNYSDSDGFRTGLLQSFGPRLSQANVLLNVYIYLWWARVELVIIYIISLAL